MKRENLIKYRYVFHKDAGAICQIIEIKLDHVGLMVSRGDALISGKIIRDIHRCDIRLPRISDLSENDEFIYNGELYIFSHADGWNCYTADEKKALLGDKIKIKIKRLAGLVGNVNVRAKVKASPDREHPMKKYKRERRKMEERDKAIEEMKARGGEDKPDKYILEADGKVFGSVETHGIGDASPHSFHKVYPDALSGAFFDPALSDGYEKPDGDALIKARIDELRNAGTANLTFMEWYDLFVKSIQLCADAAEFAIDSKEGD